MTNETTASERERCPFCGSLSTEVQRGADGWFAVRCLDCGALGPCIDLTGEGANAKWNARAALPAPADQPPSQEPQGSSGSLSESGVEAGTQVAASAFDPLPAATVLRIKKECDGLGLDIVAFAWRIQKAASHQCEAMLDKAQTEAYAEGRNDEREELHRLLSWAYRKLLPYRFATQADALAMDEIKLLLEHGA